MIQTLTPINTGSSEDDDELRELGSGPQMSPPVYKTSLGGESASLEWSSISLDSVATVPEEVETVAPRRKKVQ